ncbi:hypothetical protein [Virgibacillus salexigens]|uniref:Uncharacterized protein n=1 Tax=Virgibacillus massiliensis TaxID=1462526 RepID=A0A024QBU3_9BACI|nr:MULTISPECIES: hypothetical protein [Virgibacillus]CDQ39978.1 hypothetical protein BN990_02296 [Virgibacillus massiliensis]
MHFFKEIAKKTETVENKEKVFTVKGAQNGKISNPPLLYKSEFIKSQYLSDLREKAIEIIHKIKTYKLIRSDELLNSKNPNTLNLNIQLFKTIDVEIDVEKQSEIKKFALNNRINIESSFFELGNLKKQQNLVAITGSGNKYELIGSDDETKKYHLILDLYKLVIAIGHFEDYFEKLDSKYRLDLAIENTGTEYDEDIDIKLIMPSGSLCELNDFPVPDDEIIKLSFENTPKYILKQIESSSIKNYKFSPTETDANLDIAYYEDFYKNEYISRIKSFYIYKLYEEDQQTIITFNQSYMKAKDKVYFPSVLLFNKVPEYIRYEISSKHSSNIIKGKLEFEANE